MKISPCYHSCCLNCYFHCQTHCTCIANPLVVR